MEKQSIDFGTGLRYAGAATTAIGLVGTAVSRMINKVNNDAQCKRLIEDLSLNDPILKSVDKGTLLGWYASIYNVSPTLAKDRHTVQEVLRNFQKFGKIDLNTLKLLADTEKSVTGSQPSSIFSSVPKFF